MTDISKIEEITEGIVFNNIKCGACIYLENFLYDDGGYFCSLFLIDLNYKTNEMPFRYFRCIEEFQ